MSIKDEHLKNRIHELCRKRSWRVNELARLLNIKGRDVKALIDNPYMLLTVSNGWVQTV